MRTPLLAIALVAGSNISSDIAFGFDVSIPGIARVCDTCGGGVGGGSRLDPPWASIPYLQGAAEASGDAFLKSSAVNLGVFTKTITKESEIALNNAFRSYDKAIRDTASNLLKSANDTIEAAQAAARYAEREVNGYQQVLTKAEQRAREGKVVDAIWHLSTDSWQDKNKNAAQLAQENELMAAGMQAAAATYGGPAGAAAYAAWLTYNKTGGNVELALKAGAYAYVTASGSTAVGKMPTSTVSEVAQKAAMTGAIGGLAVAASGGSNEDALRAFVANGGAVVVQAGQSYASREYGKRIQPRLDSYCMEISGKSCAEAKSWFDKSKTRVENLKSKFSTKPSVAVIANGDWAISWDAEAIGVPDIRVPAVALTYVGENSPFKMNIDQIAAMGDPIRFSNEWSAFRASGALDAFFRFADPRHDQRSLPVAGDHLVAVKDVNVRFDPTEGAEIVSELKAGSHLVVLEVKAVSRDGISQEWMRFQKAAISQPPSLSPSAAERAQLEQNKSLIELIAAVKSSTDPQQKRQLKLQARQLIAYRFNFGSLRFVSQYSTVKSDQTYRFIKYDPVSNTLVFERKFKSYYRESERIPYKQTAELNAIATLQLNKLDKLTTYQNGSFDVDCNSPGRPCVSYEIKSEICNPSVDCESKMDSYVPFSNPTDVEVARNLRQAFIDVLYKIDGRPAN